jgi:hypothetical protein
MKLRERRELYASSNGDRWEVGRDVNYKLCVVHLPNGASGGKPTVFDIGTFLSARHNLGPEHHALIKLLRAGTLNFERARAPRFVGSVALPIAAGSSSEVLPSEELGTLGPGLR